MGHTIFERFMYHHTYLVTYIVSGNAVEWYFNYREHRPSQCSRPFTRFISRNFGSVVGGSFLNAFFSFFGIIFDIFRVVTILYSAIQRDNAVMLQNAAEIAVAVLLAYSNLLEPMHMPIFTSVGYLSAMLLDNAKPYANTLIYSRVSNHALDSID